MRKVSLIFDKLISVENIEVSLHCTPYNRLKNFHNLLSTLHFLLMNYLLRRIMGLHVLYSSPVIYAKMLTCCVFYSVKKVTHQINGFDELSS